ncbi:MAG TPA: hypothetical protein VIL72_01195 [Beijerinckiaceae bacterium]
MSFPEFERMLGAVLPSPGRTCLTLTDPPQEAGLLARMLERAAAIGAREATRLKEIHVPAHMVSALGSRFALYDLRPSADSGVVRLTFEP